VLPAASYVSTAIEAARSLARGRNIQLIELSNFHIHNAITFDQNDVGIEVHVEISNISTQGNHVHAKFTYAAALGDETSDLALAANGELKLLLVDEPPNLSLFPPRQTPPPHMISVQPSRLYNFMKGLEYDFSGAFQSLTKLERNLGNATCLAQKAKALVSDADELLVHPIDLDAAFQSVMLAYSYPGDDQLRLLHLPTSIAKLRVNPSVLASKQYTENNMTVIDSTCTTADRAEPGDGFSGSVNMYAPGLDHAAIQVDQVKFKPVGSDARVDRDVFYKMHWVPSAPDGTLAAAGVPVGKTDHDLMFVLSRIAAYYLRVFDEQLPEDDPARSTSPLCHYMNYARHMTNLLKTGQHKWAHAEWLNDTEQDVFADIADKGFRDYFDVRIMLLVNTILLYVFKGETTMLKHFRTSELLDEYYSNGFGHQAVHSLGRECPQATHRSRNPHLNMLEIGAGTGGATKTILQSIGRDYWQIHFHRYLVWFLRKCVRERLRTGRCPWFFRVNANAEIDPVQQGFEASTYDVVIAAMVVSACAKLERGRQRAFTSFSSHSEMLVLGEETHDGAMQAGAGFHFPGLCRAGGAVLTKKRTLSPMALTPCRHRNFLMPLVSRFLASTVIDDRIKFVRDPLAHTKNAVYDTVVVVGGRTAPIAKLSRGIQVALDPLAKQVLPYASLEDLNNKVLEGESVIVSLVDLEAPVFKDITPERWYKFKKLFETKREILWLTSSRLEDEPYCNMTVGFGRSAMHEEETLRVQYVDVANVDGLDALNVAKYLVRFTATVLDDKDILYTKEPEVIIDAQGQELVPRLFTITDANNRLNSTTRPIFDQVDISKDVVSLEYGEDGPNFRRLSRYELVETASTKDELTELRLTHSTASAIRCPTGYHYLALGYDTYGAQRLALTSSLASVLRIPRESTILCEPSGIQEADYLALVGAELTAVAIVDSLFAGQKPAVHNAPESIARAILAHVVTKGVKVTLTVDS
ncbi:unnamed protein product, partial [Alternaria alternata]